MRHLLAALVLAFALASRSRAQETPAAASSQTLSVFLDCQNVFCDFDYFRTEVASVNWVRDRAVADVHVLVTSQATGAGGSEYTVTFIGLRQFAGLTDTLRYVSPPSASDDDRRKGQTGLVKLGLVRYFARTPAGVKVTVNFGGTSAAAPQAAAQSDRWKAWVFRLSVNGFQYGEKTFADYNRRGSLNADRVTEKWKTRISLSANERGSRQTYPQCIDAACSAMRDTTVRVKREGFHNTALQVRAINSHVSLGARAVASASTFENHKQAYRIFPAIEYNVFPYAQSTRRQARFEYNIGYAQFNYNDTTIFNKVSESMPLQRLLVGVAFREQWGTIDIGSNAQQYLNQPSRYRIGAYGEFSLRLVKGLNLELNGGYDRIRDQFNLAKKNFSEEEILTRQFQLGTPYSYWMFFGVNYTFGSIFNNVVNPRMTSGSF
jgi:hypothetical protein